MKPAVLVTEPILETALDELRKHASVTVGRRGDYNDPGRLKKDLKSFDALLCMLSNPVSKDVLTENKHLKIVANYAVGYNNIDVAAARELGIPVANTPDVLTEATADLAVGLLLAIARKIPESEKFLRNGKFDGWDPLGFMGMGLDGKTAGIIGMGRIGTAIAVRLNAFGMKITYHNRMPLHPDTSPKFPIEFISDINHLFRQSDVIMVSCPLTEQTRHLLNTSAFEKMKSHCIVVNTARGPVIHEYDLAKALKKKLIGGAALDVFEREPAIHPELLNAPNTVLLPHIGSATIEARNDMAFLAVNAIISVLQNSPLNKIPNLI